MGVEGRPSGPCSGPSHSLGPGGQGLPWPMLGEGGPLPRRGWRPSTLCPGPRACPAQPSQVTRFRARVTRPDG